MFGWNKVVQRVVRFRVQYSLVISATLICKLRRTNYDVRGLYHSRALAALNSFLSVLASVGNFIILVLLPKESSLQLPFNVALQSLIKHKHNSCTIPPLPLRRGQRWKIITVANLLYQPS